MSQDWSKSNYELGAEMRKSRLQREAEVDEHRTAEERDKLREQLAAVTQERDRETEVRREVERHNRELREALAVKPYPDEYDDLERQLAALRAACQALAEEMRQARGAHAELVEMWADRLARLSAAPPRE
jgi:hypothetical protein